MRPFDGIKRGQALTDDGRELMRHGMARLRAVRREVGPDVTLLVDCHGRFEQTSVKVVLDLVADVNPCWVESLVPDDDLSAWQHADGTDLVLAAGESLTHLDDFETMLDGPVSVVMPDVKYVGGVRALHEVIEAAGRRGKRCSPHNPSGPVSTLASASVMAAFPETDWLEYAVEAVPVVVFPGGWCRGAHRRRSCALRPARPGSAPGSSSRCRALASRDVAATRRPHVGRR